MTAHFAHRNLPMLLLQARETAMGYFRPNLKRHGLTDQKWRVLRALDDAGELEVGQLAQASAIVGPSLSGVLDRMERDELIRRKRLETDQRRIVVELSPRGRTLVDQLADHVKAQYALIEAQIGHQDLQSLYALLDRVIALPGPDEAA